MRILLKSLTFSTLALFLSSNFLNAADKFNLIYVEQQGCIYCEIWDEELSAIYPKTAEGNFAPLVRVDISEYDEKIEFANPVVFTPTFILTKNLREIARIEGYIGDDLFWGMLEVILKRETNFDEGLIILNE